MLSPRSLLPSLGVLVAACTSPALRAPITSDAQPSDEPATVRIAPAPDARATAKAWAQSITLPGLPNLQRQSAILYRGAQPAPEGWRELESLGVRGVLSLRGFHDDHPPAGSTLIFERIPFHTLHPEDEDAVAFLRFVADPAHQPVFVHCAHGADRTGMMCAIARIVFEGWSREEAIAEMTQGGYSFHSWNQQLVRYLERADFVALAREAGISTPPR